MRGSMACWQYGIRYQVQFSFAIDVQDYQDQLIQVQGNREPADADTIYRRRFAPLLRTHRLEPQAPQAVSALS